MKSKKTIVLLLCLLVTVSMLVSCNSVGIPSEDNEIAENEALTAIEEALPDGLPTDTGVSASSEVTSQSQNGVALGKDSSKSEENAIPSETKAITGSAVTTTATVSATKTTVTGSAVITAAPESTMTTEAPKPKNIYVIIGAYGSAYYPVMPYGAIDAGKATGANIIVVGIPDPDIVEDQITLLEIAASAKADAIIISVVDKTALAPAVRTAYILGFPIILTQTIAETNNYSMSFTTDNVAAGGTAAAELIRLLKEKGVREDKKGRIAVQIGSFASETIINRNAGFKEFWDANAPTSWEVMWDTVHVNDGDIMKAISIGHDVLATESDLIGLYAPNNGSTAGFAVALMETNRTDIAMVGFDLSPEIEELIKSERFGVSALLQNQYKMGYDSVMAALDLANGGKVPAQKDVDTSVIIVNSSNVDSKEVRQAAYGAR